MVASHGIESKERRQSFRRMALVLTGRFPATPLPGPTTRSPAVSACLAAGHLWSTQSQVNPSMPLTSKSRLRLSWGHVVNTSSTLGPLPAPPGLEATWAPCSLDPGTRPAPRMLDTGGPDPYPGPRVKAITPSTHCRQNPSGVSHFRSDPCFPP
jgi:hypothetical protein